MIHKVYITIKSVNIRRVLLVICKKNERINYRSSCLEYLGN